MSMCMRRALIAALLVCSGGALLAMAGFAVAQSPHLEGLPLMDKFGFPGVCAACFLAGLFLWRRMACAAQGESRRRLQVFLTDLLVAAFGFGGILFVCYLAMKPKKFLQVGVPLAFFLGLGLVVGLAVANGKAIASYGRRFLFAFAVSGTLNSALVLGAMLAIAIWKIWFMSVAFGSLLLGAVVWSVLAPKDGTRDSCSLRSPTPAG